MSLEMAVLTRVRTRSKPNTLPYEQHFYWYRKDLNLSSRIDMSLRTGLSKMNLKAQLKSPVRLSCQDKHQVNFA